MKVKLTDWNIQDYLKTTEDRAFYLEAAIEEAAKTNDMKFLAEAFCDVAHAISGEKVAMFFDGVATVIKAMPMSTPKSVCRKAYRKLAMA